MQRKFVWSYACTQFALVVLSAHLFYSLVSCRSPYIHDWADEKLSVIKSSPWKVCTMWQNSIGRWPLPPGLLYDVGGKVELIKVGIWYWLFCLIFGHLQLHMQAVLSVILATFTGFGFTMCATSILVELSRCRDCCMVRSGQNPQNMDPDPSSITAHQNRSQQQPQETEGSGREMANTR